MFWRWGRWPKTIAAILLGLVISTVALFVLPPSGGVQHADAVVLIDDGEGYRLKTAVRLVKAGAAPILVISHRPDRPQDCLTDIPNVTIYCYNPNPNTTQGEARKIGELASQQHWKSVIFVTDRAHVFRARFRLEQCFDGKLTAVTSPMPSGYWPYRLPYEWAATLRALTLQRTC
jgi:uncharacterized SAM-binding protein YcdF (DUF218 family)